MAIDTSKIFVYSVPKATQVRQEPDPITGELKPVDYFVPDGVPLGLPMLMFDDAQGYVIITLLDLTQYGLVLDATHIQITRQNFRTFINGRKSGMFERIRDEWAIRSR